MAESTIDNVNDREPILDRTINLTAVTWSAVAWVAVIFVAILLRFLQLGQHPLSSGEAHLASDAYRFVTGETTGPGNALRNTAPATVLLESLAMFLFGDSDAAARTIPALLGVGMVASMLGLRSVVGNARALGMATLLALSPTVLFASRTATNEIVVAAFTLFSVIAFLRIGTPASNGRATRNWAAFAGVCLAATFGAGPSGLSVLAAILLSAAAATLLDTRADSAFRAALRSLTSSRECVAAFAGTFVITTFALFTHLFSDFRALAGLGETFADWGRLLTTSSSATPTQFFLLAVLLYEILAVVFAIVAASRPAADGDPVLPWTFFAVWFAASLLLFSFSSGGQPEHSIHVALPIVLLGGAALGELVSGLDRDAVLRGRLGLLWLVSVGWIVALLAQLVLLGRINDAIDQGQAIFEAIATFVLALAPLSYAAVVLIQGERKAGRGKHIGAIALLAVSVFLGAYTVRSAVMLSFFNSDQPIELVAQRTSTPAVDSIVKRITHLSRDTTLTEGSARDPQGGHGLTIAIDKRVQWPYRWYLRDFPDATVVAEGQAPLSGAQVVIAPDDTGMTEAGYTPTNYPTTNRVPGTYLAPEFGEIMRGVVLPSRWEEGFRYLLFREMASTAEPETVTVGLTGDLAAKVSGPAAATAAGPYTLFDRAGAGNAQGQFDQPRGIAVSPDGEQIYVVEMGNARVQHFDAVGDFIDAWGPGEEKDVQLARTENGLGPTGVAVGPDGLVYVADTWNHRILVLDDGGHVVREFGSFGNTEDATDASPSPGLFFGPRGIAIYNDEIYVVDTGNERVQVFSLDGTFQRAWGGHGTTPEQFIEPVGIAIDASGQVYVADSSNARISVFTTTGAPVTQWPVDVWGGQAYFEPYMAFDDAGYLYVSSSATGSVEIFDQQGIPLQSLREVGGEQLEEPIGVAYSPDGSIYITDKGRNAVFQYVIPGGMSEGLDDGIVIDPETGAQIIIDPDTGEEILIDPVTGEEIVPDDGLASPEVSGETVPDDGASPEASPAAIVPDDASPEPAAVDPTVEASPTAAVVTMASPAASPVASPVASPIASPAASPATT